MLSLNRLLISLLTITLLTACGWHLRGQANIPPALRILDVNMAKADFTTQKLLRNALKSNSVTISSDASYQLQIVKEESKKRTLSVSASAKASEFELLQVLTFKLLNDEGQALTTELEIKSYRTQQYDPDASAGKAQEEKQIRRELKRDNVNKLLLKLQATKVNQLKPILTTEEQNATRSSVRKSDAP